MNLRNKKGFITIYVMLAMMFFIVFVVTASVTASRKIKLQTEANSALYDIYSEDIEHIVQNTTDIPIYTKEQFVRIINWLATDDSIKTTEYMYINDIVYTLDAGRYNGETGYKNTHPEHSFTLKTDIWLEGSENTTDDANDKSDYPFIPNIHAEYKDSKEIINKSGHNIYLQVDTNMYVYDVEEIQIATAEDFLKIGTGELLSNGIPATSNLNYSIVKSIEIPDGMIRNKDITVNFSGTIKGNDKIISGLKLEQSFFDINSGTIENLTFVNASVGKATETITIDKNLGIIAGTNSGTINDCNIMLKKNYDENSSITPNTIQYIRSTGSIGGMVGRNEGTISNCEIQGIDISNCNASNIGGVVGVNEGKIINITVNGKIQINSPGASTIGGICGWNYGGTIELIEIKSNIQIKNIESASYDVGGIAGKNGGTISKILIDGQPEKEGEKNFGNITIINETNSYQDNGNIGLITGKNNKLSNWYGIVEYCIVNGSIENSESNITKLNIGGIVGELSDNSNCTISHCYSNVQINSSGSSTTSEGGIVGYLNNGTIDNCAYVNAITSNQSNPIGGIVGLLNVNNSPMINNCYMNGSITKSSKSGAVIGTIEGTSGKINAGTSDYPVYYNQAFRWIGYASTLTGITLDYNCEAKASSELLTPITNLKGIILSEINSSTN